MNTFQRPRGSASRGSGGGDFFSTFFSGFIGKLIAFHVGFWILQMGLELYLDMPISHFLALTPAKVLMDFWAWQLLTYMFLHSSQVTHILFNMLILWMIGGELHKRWGTRTFLFFYLFNGVASGLIYCLGVGIYYFITGSATGLIAPVVGASGALYACLIAYGMLFSERMMSFFFLFPMKAKHFVILIGFMDFMSLLTSKGGGDGVAYLAHLGGLLSGYLFLLAWARQQEKKWTKKNAGPPSGGGGGRGKLKLVVDNEKKSDDSPKYWN